MNFISNVRPWLADWPENICDLKGIESFLETIPRHLLSRPQVLYAIPPSFQGFQIELVVKICRVDQVIGEREAVATSDGLDFVHYVRVPSHDRRLQITCSTAIVNDGDRAVR